MTVLHACGIIIKCDHSGKGEDFGRLAQNHKTTHAAHSEINRSVFVEAVSLQKHCLQVFEISDGTNRCADILRVIREYD
jgi:hypothetical protein